MSKFLTIVLLLTCFLAFLPLSLKSQAQPIYGQLKFKIKAPKKYMKYWDLMILRNEETTFRFWLINGKSKWIDSIPAGSYTATLISMFNDKVEQKVFVAKNRSIVHFDVTESYSDFKDSISMLDQLDNG